MFSINMRLFLLILMLKFFSQIIAPDISAEGEKTSIKDDKVEFSSAQMDGQVLKDGEDSLKNGYSIGMSPDETSLSVSSRDLNDDIAITINNVDNMDYEIEYFRGKTDEVTKPLKGRSQTVDLHKKKLTIMSKNKNIRPTSANIELSNVTSFNNQIDNDPILFDNVFFSPTYDMQFESTNKISQKENSKLKQLSTVESNITQLTQSHFIHNTNEDLEFAPTLQLGEVNYNDFEFLANMDDTIKVENSSSSLNKFTLSNVSNTAVGTPIFSAKFEQMTKMTKPTVPYLWKEALKNANLAATESGVNVSAKDLNKTSNGKVSPNKSIEITESETSLTQYKTFTQKAVKPERFYIPAIHAQTNSNDSTDIQLRDSKFLFWDDQTKPNIQNDFLNPYQLLARMKGMSVKSNQSIIMENLRTFQEPFDDMSLSNSPSIEIQIYCNPNFKIGVRQKILISLEKMPIITAVQSLSTNDYLIDYFIAHFSDDTEIKNIWMHTEFLGQELIRLGIRENGPLAFQRGYYRVVPATFWEIGDQKLTLILMDPMDNRRVYAMKSRDIKVRGEHKLMCYPKIVVNNCGNPQQPRIITLDEVIEFNVGVEEHCGTSKHEDLHWNLCNIEETDVLKHLGKSKEFVFYTKFTLSTIRPGLVYLLLRVETVIRNVRCIARCYLYVPPPQLLPIIVGGPKRLITNSKVNILDGSLSKDYATKNSPVQAENIKWKCLSLSDPKNAFCNKLHETSVKLEIPAYTFHIGKTYQIILKLQSKLYPFITMDARQQLQVIESVAYTPHIICRDNCESDHYTPNRLVHLEAQCFDCPKKKRVSFEWFLNGERYNYLLNSGSQEHFISYLQDANSKKGSNIVLKMKVGRNFYQNEVNLLEFFKPDVSVCYVVEPYKYSEKELKDRYERPCQTWWYDSSYYEVIKKGEEARYRFFVNCWWRGEPYKDYVPTVSSEMMEYCKKYNLTDFKYYCFPFCDKIQEKAVRLPDRWRGGYWNYRIESITDPPVPIAGDLNHFVLRYRFCETKQINITLCNVFEACQSITTDIDVQPVELDSSYSSIKNFLTDTARKTNIRRQLFYWRDWQAAFIIAYTAAKKINDCTMVGYLHNQMNGFQTKRVIELEQLLFLINTLTVNVKDVINSDCAFYFGNWFIVSAENMNILANNWAHIRLRLLEYILNTFLNMTATLSDARENHMKAMCKPSDYTCNKGNDYAENYNDLGHFDPDITRKLSNWFHCTKHLVHNIYTMSVLFAQTVNSTFFPIKRHKQNVYMSINLLTKSTERHVQIDSIDNLTRIYISKSLINELRGKMSSQRIIVELLTQPFNDGLFWWYPQPTPMSSSVLFIYAGNGWRVYHKRVIYIDNPIIFDTNATKPNNFSLNLIMTGLLRSRLNIQTYHMIVPPKSVVVATIISNNDTMLMLIKLNRPPSGDEIINEGCHISVNSTLKRIRLSNTCETKTSAYISFMPNIGVFKKRSKRSTNQILGEDRVLKNPVNYSYTLEIYECTDWVNSDHSPGWTSNNCITIVDPDSEYIMRCSCHIFGPFSPRIYPAYARLHADKALDPEFGINWILLFIYLILLILSLFVLFCHMGTVATREKESMISCGQVEQTVMKTIRGNDVVVMVTTGGRSNAGTSANVTLHFKSEDVPLVMYDIAQDPEHPKLKRNSTVSLKLGSDAIILPTKLRIEIDNQGRYPSWYCRNILIQDLQRDTRQLFRVKRWIHNTTTEWIESENYSTPYHHVEPYTWRDRMRKTFEENIINWFLFQPLLGPWQTSNNASAMNRYERTCVWICKFAACVAITACYFGITSRQEHNIEKQEMKQPVDFPTVLIVAVLCYMGCIAYDLFFHIIVMRCILRRY